MPLKIIRSIKKLKGKTVLLRVDYNVPLENRRVTDDYKISQSLPTIRFLRQRGAKVILITHLGRPRHYDKKLSTAPVAKRLEQMFGQRVAHVPFVKDWHKLTREKLPDAPIVMLDNIRFYKEEEKQTPAFTKQLARLGDIFVFDGFAVAHRASASVTGIAKYLPCYAGLLLANEMFYLKNLLQRPARPFVVVLGGVKTETKIPFLKTLVSKADYVLIGGGIANTYTAALGYALGSSSANPDHYEIIKKYGTNKKVIFPLDYVVGDQNGQKTYCIVTEAMKLPKGLGVYDIGPSTVRLYAEYIKRAQTIIWNGAMGKFEVPVYGYGTKALACLIAARSKGRAMGIVGGGETVQLVRDLGLTKEIDWVSTGGGAMLDFLSGRRLPGLEQCVY